MTYTYVLSPETMLLNEIAKCWVRERNEECISCSVKFVVHQKDCPVQSCNGEEIHLEWQGDEWAGSIHEMLIAFVQAGFVLGYDLRDEHDSVEKTA